MVNAVLPGLPHELQKDFERAARECGALMEQLCVWKIETVD